MTDTVGLPDDVTAWIENVAGGRLVRAHHEPGGARKEAWHVGVEKPVGDVTDLFLRLDRSDPSPRDPWTLAREARVYLALQGTAVPVPRVLGVHPNRQAMLAERLEGGNWFSRIADPDEQLATARDFIVHLAALHRIDPATIELPGFPTPTTIPALVAHELDEWEAVLAARGGEPDPGLRFTLAWLRDNIPPADGRVALVQGDTGPGNFLYAEGRVIAIVDWELAHFGDPMEDIAWLCLRATQEPFTHLPDRLREYEALSGYDIDDDRVRYYRVMAEAKLLVMGHRGDATGGSEYGGDLGNRLIYGMLHHRLWLEAMADVLGFESAAPEPPPASEPTRHQPLYEEVLDQMRDYVVPNVGDPLARQRAKGIARAVKYLAAISRDGSFYEARELDDLAELLGERPASIEVGRAALVAAVRAGVGTHAQYFWYLQRRAARDNELLRQASGVLADRHWPPLR
jgi:aminoglycoside phosphotransferase (APT) family kinase protein